MYFQCYYNYTKIEYNLKIFCTGFREELSTFFIVSDC
jgi:hypothetical protein